MLTFNSELHQKLYNHLIEIEEWHFYIIESDRFGFWHERGGDIIFYSGLPDVVYLGDNSLECTDWRLLKWYTQSRIYDIDAIDFQCEK